LVILDWVMPGLDGLEICRRLRETPGGKAAYVILLTSRDATCDLVEGLEGGADDYVVKPFRPEELRARVRAGLRVAALQRSLAERVADLEQALAEVNQLQGLLPICCYCKRIRDDGNYWQQLEGYISRRSNARFSHGICPECFEELRVKG
jgi:CheY-like chemotaxis protein